MEKYKVWNEYGQYLGVWELTGDEHDDLMKMHPFWKIQMQ